MSKQADELGAPSDTHRGLTQRFRPSLNVRSVGKPAANGTAANGGPFLARRQGRTNLFADGEDDPLPSKAEEGPHVRLRDVLGGWFGGNEHAGEGEAVNVEHYIQDKSFRQRLILLSRRNSSIGIRLLLLKCLVYLVGTMLYVAEVIFLDYFPPENYTVSKYLSNPNHSVENDILTLVFVAYKPWPLWALQVIVGIFVLLYAAFGIYIVSTSSRIVYLYKALDLGISISLFVGILYISTLFFPTILRDLYVPGFLLIWPARIAVTNALIYYNQRSLAQLRNSFRLKAGNLVVLVFSFAFTWVCLLHHFERIGNRLTLFDTYWFVVVTFSTVGYGDIHPNHWTSKLLVTLFIVAGLILLIPKLEELYETFQIQRRLHNSVRYQKSSRHIMVCSTHIKPFALRDFLTEFYSDPSHYEVHCVVLVENELPDSLRVYLSHPFWSRRITTLIGVPTRSTDLSRASAQTADACFIHTARNVRDPQLADMHSILSAWAVKDFAPNCQLYVQIIKPANRMYLTDVADHIVCEEELNHAILANHTHCPGISTLVTLLLHTFRPEKHDFYSEDFQLYSQCAPCEIYESRAGSSKYFHHFVNKNFLYTAVVAFRKYHVTLIGVQGRTDKHIKLNPGLDHIIQEDDTCYYIGFTKEEYSHVQEDARSARTGLWQTCASAAYIMLALGGMNPYKITEHPEDEATDGPPESPRPASPPEKHAHFFLPQDDSNLSLSPSPSTHNVAGDPRLEEKRHIDARRGLQLLRFHSRMDLHANPIVKVNLVLSPTFPLTFVLPPSSRKYEMCLLEEEEEMDSCLDAVPLSPKAMEEGKNGGVAGPEKKAAHSLFGRSFSHPNTVTLEGRRGSAGSEGRRGAGQEGQRGARLEVVSRNSLHSSEVSLGSTHSEHPVSLLLGHQSFFHHAIRRRPSLHSLHSNNSEVVLELAGMEEEVELEELEDGHCPEELSDSQDEGSPAPSPPSPTHSSDEGPQNSCDTKKYVTGVVTNTPYFGCETLECYLLPVKRSHDQIRLDWGSGGAGPGHEEAGLGCEGEGPGCEGAGSEGKTACCGKAGAVIAFCEEATEELFHFVTPLRASYLPHSSLKPIVIMVEKEPSASFLDTIAPFPKVFYTTGDLLNVDDWLRAGVLLAESAVIIGSHVVHDHDQGEHMVDARHILAAQKLNKLFPKLNILTEIHYRYSIRFMRFTMVETYLLKSLFVLPRRSDHLTYLFVPQFASGRAFCPSMLDTLLYQAYMKPYIIDLTRQLLGCKQAPDCGFLWKMKVTEPLLKLLTYGRLFQRLAFAHRTIPIGIYRTVPIETCPEIGVASPERSGEHARRASTFVQAKMEGLGLQGGAPHPDTTQYQSFVLTHPSPSTRLKPNDVILVLKPPHSSIHDAEHGNGTIKTKPGSEGEAPPPYMSNRTASSPNGTEDTHGLPPSRLHPPGAPPTCQAQGRGSCQLEVPVECYHLSEQ